jgi:hypothetical protein
VLTSLCALDAACHLILKENATIVTIVDLFFAIHAAVRSLLRLLWHQIPKNLIVSVIIVLIN